MLDTNKIYCMDALELLKQMPDNSVDLVLTDPPYQLSYVDRWGKTNWEKENYKRKELEEGGSVYTRSIKGFMGKTWDVLPEVEVWKECLRVMKSGAFAFIMTTPRQDSLGIMINRLKEAGFVIGFTSIYWTYATGFPKATNIGKMVDKRLGNEREVVGETQWIDGSERKQLPKKATVDYAGGWQGTGYGLPITKGNSEYEGSYAGFQPKPAVEIILVVMKPLSEKNYIEQALKNTKGITWLDDCRIPFVKSDSPVGGYGNMDIDIGKPLEHQNYIPKKRGNLNSTSSERKWGYKECVEIGTPKGRFPANLLVSDDVLNNGDNSLGSHNQKFQGNAKSIFGMSGNNIGYVKGYTDNGSFSRYFDLDFWFEEKIKKLPEEAQKTFPFLIVPKASRSEKNKGLDKFEEKEVRGNYQDSSKLGILEVMQNSPRPTNKNNHPTIKPLKLISWLVTLGSRENDLILDPFMGSGTTAIACELLRRKWIGIEKEEEYIKIANARIKSYLEQTKLLEVKQ